MNSTHMWLEKIEYLKGYTLLRSQADLEQYLETNGATDYSYE